ncbi:MAG: helix-turn-helix domain-containing protein [Rikenellaceae bacterium]
MSLPEHMRSGLYKRSLRIMGIAFLIVPISCFISTRHNQFDLDALISPAINLTAYFATFILMALAFHSMLGKNFNRLVYKLSFAAIVIYPLPLWVSIISGREELIDTVMTASYSFLVIIVVLLVASVEINYRRVLKNIENYYSDDVIICVEWIAKSMLLMIGLSVTCIVAPIFFTCSPYVKLIFMVYGVLCYIYIYYGYQKMLFNITERFIEVNITDCISDDGSGSSLHGATKAKIMADLGSSLEVWIAEQRYTQKGITINDVAKAIKSNRTYLSRYINTTYGCSFRSWITALRLEEAKRLLLSNPKHSISEISELIGFASVESFTHIFSRSEGTAPAKWRERNTDNSYKN